MGSSVTRLSRPGEPGVISRGTTSTSPGYTRLTLAAWSEVWDAAARLLSDPPSELAGLPRQELGRHLIWLARAVRGDNGARRPSDHGAFAVARRRIIDAVRGDLLARWSREAPASSRILEVLDVLERARVACRPAVDQSFVSELTDSGGLDLVVEVAHDMRSPLTSVLFLSEILHRGQSGELTETQKRQLGIIYSAALGLVGMASDMIEVARGGDRLDSGSPTPMSVNELLASVGHLVGPTAEEKRLELQIIKLSSSHRLGYPIPLSRVLLNLTTNALKFTHEGYVQLSAEPVEGNTVEFAVRDTGPGIPAESMDTLYQPFRRQPKRETGYSFSGTGLGLAICRRLVGAMGAQLHLETRAGWGTRFSFRLDLPPARVL
jgi:signal transduction histidine kinase